MLKRICLVLLIISIFPLSSYGNHYTCKGFYDFFDDTCYFGGGAFVFFGYENGSREVVKNGKSVRYFFYFDGSPYVYSRWRYWRL